VRDPKDLVVSLNQRNTVRWVRPGEANIVVGGSGGTGGTYSQMPQVSTRKPQHEWNYLDERCHRCGKSRYSIERDGFDPGCKPAETKQPAKAPLKGYYDID